MSMENILELQQVSKTFPKSNFTLENVTFSLPYGAILGFVGENGAGKTTTIGCILNTITKDSGTVKLFGQEMLDADTSLREKIGVVYDGDNFPAYWTAKQLSEVMEGLYTQWDNSLFQKYFPCPIPFKKPAIKYFSLFFPAKLHQFTDCKDFCSCRSGCTWAGKAAALFCMDTSLSFLFIDCQPLLFHSPGIFFKAFFSQLLRRRMYNH